MSLFGRFLKPGIPGSRGPMTGWWAEAFTPEEQTTIVDQFTKYPPLGTTFDTKRLPTTPRFLIDAGTWFTRADMAPIRIRLLEKALSELGDEANPADRHFTYIGLIEAWYKLRDVDPAALGNATEYCQRMIAIAPDAKAALMRDGIWPQGTGLGHPGYNQLVVILDKQGRLREAIELSRQAQQQGWSGDWDARIDRYEKKLAKSPSTHRTSAST